MESPPLGVASVFTFFQQVLAPPVVWVFVEDPGAVLDVDRVDLAKAPAVLQAGHVLTELHHLASEVWTLVDAESVPAGWLQHQTQTFC